MKGNHIMFIHGGRKRQRELVASMVDYCIESMMPHLAGKVELMLELNPRLQQEEHLVGYCIAVDERRCTREVEIAIHSALGIKDMLTVVAHEMVHVKQLALGERHDKRGRIYWRGVDMTEANYEDSPWEIDAYAREDLLFKGWLDEYHHILSDKEALEIMENKKEI